MKSLILVDDRIAGRANLKGCAAGIDRGVGRISITHKDAICFAATESEHFSTERKKLYAKR